MPSRWTSLAILAFWLAATATLLTRDVVPRWFPSAPPNLRTIARANADATPTAWRILVMTNPLTMTSFRSVGEATSTTRTLADGRVRMESRVIFDAAGLLRGTPFDTKPAPTDSTPGGQNPGNPQPYQLAIDSVFEIDAAGELQRFHADVRDHARSNGPGPGDSSKAGNSREPALLRIEGERRGDSLNVRARGPEGLKLSRSFPFPRGSMAQSSLSPIDRMPGLQLGQRWESQVVNPITGAVDAASVVVKREQMIQWNGEYVRTFEVHSTLNPFVARTWTRPDGLVLRQEVPFPLVKLVLERLPDATECSTTKVVPALPEAGRPAQPREAGPDAPKTSR